MEERRKIYSLISIVALLIFITSGSVLFWQFMNRFNGDPQLLKEFLNSYGEGNSAIILIGLQILQIVFPIIPGEVIELGAGYVFGAWKGLLLCEVGILIASFPVFIMVRIFGNKLVSVFFSTDKLKSISFLQNETRLTQAVFILFFLPGTPKDLLTYFVGLTPIKTSRFLLITIFARIPSILTSTLVGSNFGNDNTNIAIILYLATIIISVIGLIIFNMYTKAKQN